MHRLSPSRLSRLPGATRKFLRTPKVIFVELSVLAVLCAVGASLPQQGVALESELRGFYDRGAWWSELLTGLGFDRVFHSAPFLAVVCAIAASLLVIVLEQWRRVRVLWRQKLSVSHFHTAPYRLQFERPASHSPENAVLPRVNIWTERRAGLAGSAVFHTGLLLVIAAAAWRALFGVEAVVDLIEGEDLPPTAAAWAGQWPGLAAKPMRFEQPVTLLGVKASRYGTGDLEDLNVRVRVGTGSASAEHKLAVNRDLRLPGGRLFLANEFGPTALLEWRKPDGSINRQAALLKSPGGGRFEGAIALPTGERVFLRAHVDRKGNAPQRVEMRVMDGNALVFNGDPAVGETVSLPKSDKLTLCGTPFWARVRGSRDSALWLAYAGFALVMAGATLIFTLTKLDCCVVVSAAGERESVFVALKPQRFAPLFQERFHRLVAQSGYSAATPFAPSEAPLTAQQSEPRTTSAQPAPSGFGLSGLIHKPGLPLLTLLLLGLTGCSPSPVEQGRQLVQRYNDTVAEAYRRGDAKFADPVVGPSESKKLVGLIGVRLDLGLTLDSELLSLEVIGVDRQEAELRVRTRERWRYRDRRIGSGKQVGEESLDKYEMLYVFKQDGKEWLMDEIQFTAPPEVGRTQLPWPSGHGSMQARAKPAEAEEVQQR